MTIFRSKIVCKDLQITSNSVWMPRQKITFSRQNRRNIFLNFFCWNSVWNIGKNKPKNANFQFLINRPIRPILMFYKLGKVSLGNFKPNPRYWAHNPRIHGNITFFGVKCHFWAFSHKWKFCFSVEYSTGIEISTNFFTHKKTYDVSWYQP